MSKQADSLKNRENEIHFMHNYVVSSVEQLAVFLQNLGKTWNNFQKLGKLIAIAWNNFKIFEC